MTNPEELLADPQALEEADQGGTLRLVAMRGARIRRAAALRELDPEAGAALDAVAADGRPRALVLLGYGTGATVAKLISAVVGAGASVPILSVPGPALPGWIGPLDLVVVASTTGRSPEIAAALTEAGRRGCRIVVVAPPTSELAGSPGPPGRPCSAWRTPRHRSGPGCGPSPSPALLAVEAAGILPGPVLRGGRGRSGRRGGALPAEPGAVRQPGQGDRAAPRRAPARRVVGRTRGDRRRGASRGPGRTARRTPGAARLAAGSRPRPARPARRAPRRPRPKQTSSTTRRSTARAPAAPRPPSCCCPRPRSSRARPSSSHAERTQSAALHGRRRAGHDVGTRRVSDRAGRFHRALPAIAVGVGPEIRARRIQEFKLRTAQ